MTQHLLILTAHAEQYAALINQADLPDLQLYLATTVQEAQPFLSKIDMILGTPQRVCQIINQAEQVRWVQSTWAGVETLLEHKEARRDYILTRVGGVFGQQMSEYVFAHLILQIRGDWSRYQHQQEKRWLDDLPGTLNGRTIGIMGVGSIGSHLAQTAKHFGMTVWGYSRRSEGCPQVDRYFHEGEICDFVAGVDFVVNTLPQTATSVHIINRQTLAAMKQSAILVNVGRGSAVDEAALAEALQSGQIAGAVLDVFEQEPLPASHPLWQTPNTVITSHTAAVSYPDSVVKVFIDNYNRLIENRPLVHVVDFAQGY